MTLYTPMTDGELGRAAQINYRLQELEDAILEGEGLMRARTAWTTLSADAASITIPVTAGDNTLMLMANLMTDYGAQAYDTVLLTFNNDTASTYTVRYGSVDGGGSVVDASGTTGFPLAKAAGTNATNNYFSFLKFTIPQASDLLAKACRYSSMLPYVPPTYNDGLGIYPTAATIASIKLAPLNGTVFVSGSRYALFGVN